MKKHIFMGFALSLFAYESTAQKLPACIQKLNKQTSLTATRFERTIALKRNRTVYQFSVKSARQCMDCDNGLIYYDTACNMIAYFMMGRGTNAFVAEGYTAADFGKAGYPNIRYGTKKPEASKQ